MQFYLDVEDICLKKNGMFGNKFPVKYHIFFTVLMRGIGRLTLVSKKETISLTIKGW